MGNHRTGSDICAGSDLYRSDHGRIATDKGLLSNAGLMFLSSVVITEDRAGSNVRSSSDLGVSQISKVARLRSGAELCFL